MDVNSASMQVWRLMDGGEISDDSKWVMTDFQLAVQQAAAYLIIADFWDTYNKLGESLINSNYIEYFKNVKVLYDEDTAEYYVPIPSDIISLPKNYAMQFVGRNKNMNDPFTPIDLGKVSFYSQLPQDIISYYITANDIRFVRFDPLVTDVKLGYIPATPNEINADDLVRIKDLLRKDFMPATLQIPEDKTNNSAPVNAQ
jgi:hypothetical protein